MDLQLGILFVLLSSAAAFHYIAGNKASAGIEAGAALLVAGLYVAAVVKGKPPRSIAVESMLALAVAIIGIALGWFVSQTT